MIIRKMNYKKEIRIKFKKGRVNTMDNNTIRYCTPSESLKESLKEMKLIREGKREKRSYWDMMNDFDEQEWEVGGDYVDNVLFIENYMCNEDEKCEWDTISDIFSKAVHKKSMSKSDIVKMIAETKNEVRKR